MNCTGALASLEEFLAVVDSQKSDVTARPLLVHLCAHIGESWKTWCEAWWIIDGVGGYAREFRPL